VLLLAAQLMCSIDAANNDVRHTMTCLIKSREELSLNMVTIKHRDNDETHQ
jgi:hypothetical protein